MYFENENSKSLSSKKDMNVSISGASETFNILNDGCELKIDILAQTHSGSTIWGKIKDTDGNSISNALVRLVQASYTNNSIEYINIAKCISDSNGFYQFNINPSKDDSAYKIMVSKTHIENIN